MGSAYVELRTFAFHRLELERQLFRRPGRRELRGLFGACGKLTEPPDCFEQPFWRTVQQRVAEKALEERIPLMDLTGALIVIVDDEAPVADATGMLLSSEGFEVLTAASEREALERLSGRTPDLLIADYHLRNGETGAGAIRAIREHVRVVIPAVLVSGDTSDSDTLSSLEDVAFLTKPVDTDEFLNRVRRQLGER